MRKLITAIIMGCLIAVVIPSYAANDYSVRTIKGFQANELVKRGDVRIYKITFTATSNTATFTLYDCLTIGEGSNTNVKTEGAEATSGNGKCYNFYNDPIDFSTGAYLVVSDMNVVIEYN